MLDEARWRVNTNQPNSFRYQADLCLVLFVVMLFGRKGGRNAGHWWMRCGWRALLNQHLSIVPKQCLINLWDYSQHLMMPSKFYRKGIRRVVGSHLGPFLPFSRAAKSQDIEWLVGTPPTAIYTYPVADYLAGVNVPVSRFGLVSLLCFMWWPRIALLVVTTLTVKYQTLRLL